MKTSTDKIYMNSRIDWWRWKLCRLCSWLCRSTLRSLLEKPDRLLRLVRLIRNHSTDLVMVDSFCPFVSSSGERGRAPDILYRYRKGKSKLRVERLEGIHYPTLLSCNNRRRCVFHPEIKQRYFCPTCDVALCLSDVPEKGCWYKYHHEEDWRDIW